jgi:aspartate aminotransferase
MLTTENPELLVSDMAENLIGSEIIKLAAEINEMIKNGERIFNFTIGDFDPSIFPIPEKYREEIIKAYGQGHTNYPPANGTADLRQSVLRFLEKYQQLTYNQEEILISGGARPLIYAVYQTLLDKSDKVVYPVPSWNNNHYCHLSSAQGVAVETKPENNFMPTAEELRPHLKGATLLSICSPLNPTGTIFTKEGLERICDLVIEENNSREPGSKPLYILYDQIYWVLTFGDNQHYNPVSLRPELKNYTIFIDGLSKSFAATGVRVGWAFGPQRIIEKMKTILGHIGAWAPKAEQVASARYMSDYESIEQFLSGFRDQINRRLQGFYAGFKALRQDGFSVDAIAPQAAIYLTVKIDIKGRVTADGKKLENGKDVASYILHEAKLALVPFHAFGSNDSSSWYRLSVGTCKLEEIDEALNMLRKALQKLHH